MTAAPFHRETELAEAGLQTLVSRVRPIASADRLALGAAVLLAPTREPNAEQSPCEVKRWRAGQDQPRGGLFDTAMRDQRDLIDAIRTAERGASLPTPTRKD